jgi:DNA-directed RNA polymerase specialized sigma24 family protein
MCRYGRQLGRWTCGDGSSQGCHDLVQWSTGARLVEIPALRCGWFALCRLRVGWNMLADNTGTDTFEDFMRLSEPRLQDALGAMFGPEIGREVTAEALAYAWVNWERVRVMENPVGYLFVLARDRARRSKRSRRITLMPVPEQRAPWVEPGLPGALGTLSEKQRIVVMLLHCFDWTMAEVADLLDVSKGTVQSYEQRGMRKLRRKLGVQA